MLRRRSLPIVIALTAVMAACSSGNDATGTSTSSAATPTTTTTTTTQPATTTTQPATAISTVPAAPDDELTPAQLADQVLARTALIKLDDFPDGWFEIPDVDDVENPSDEVFTSQFEACLGRNDDERVGDDLRELAVSTGDFEPTDDDDESSVSHEVILAPDEATAITAMSELRFNGSETCLAGVVEAFYIATFADNPKLANVEIGDVVVTQPELAAPADEAIGVVVEVPLTAGGVSGSQFLEFLYQRQGRALSELAFSSFGEPFDRAGYTVLGDEVAQRLAAVGF